MYGSKGASRANSVESALKTKWRRTRTLDYTGAFMEACLNSYQYFSVIILVELLHDKRCPNAWELFEFSLRMSCST